MKNKNGFTLVELLCVIVLLAVLTVAATTGIMKLSSKSKENLYCAKIKMIESIAVDYSSKLEKQLNESTELYNGMKSIKIKVSDLVNAGKLEADQDNKVINPINNESMNDVDIIIYLYHNQISAVIANNICL